MTTRLLKRKSTYLLPLVALLAVMVRPFALTVTGAPPRAAIQAESWTESAARRQQTAVISERQEPDGARTRAYESQPHKVSFRFNAVASAWQARVPADARVRLAVRTSSDGGSWSEWSPVGADHQRAIHSGRGFGNLLMITGTLMQYRLVTSGPAPGRMPEVTRLSFTFINSEQGPGANDVSARKGVAHAAEAPRIISRAEWGALESLRFDDAGVEIWTRDYETPRQAIIHDTVTINNDPNPPATIRAIYYYHAVVRGWGDIGYNYLIDHEGNIYEGRAGGENVMGGHALCANRGTIGIAALGEYSELEPSDAMVSALQNLIAWKFDENELDPFGYSPLISVPSFNIPNIAAHRDVLDICGNTHLDPGQLLYDLFPEIRVAVAALMEGSDPSPTPTDEPTEPAPTETGEPTEPVPTETPTPAPTATPDDGGTPPGNGARYVVVNTNGQGLNLQAEPGADSEVLGVVPEGTTITEISSKLDGWIKTQYEGEIGYLWFEYLRDPEEAAAQLKPDPSRRYRVKPDGLNLRGEPSRSSRVLTVVPRGQIVPELGLEPNGWVKTTYRGNTGYLWSVQLAVVESQEPPPPPEEEPDRLPPGTRVVIDGTPGALRLREGPGTDTRILVRMLEGESAKVTDVQQHGWYPLEYTSARGARYEGWAWGRFLQEQEDDTAPPPPPVDNSDPQWEVISNGVYLREAPSRRSAALQLVPRGEVVQEIASEADGWVKAQYNGSTGYLWHEALQVIASDEPPPPVDDADALTPGKMATVRGTPVDLGGLNLREGPDREFEVVTVMPEGSKVRVTDVARAGWVPVEYIARDGRRYSGWAWHEFLRADGSRATRTAGAMTLAGALALPVWNRRRKRPRALR